MTIRLDRLKEVMKVKEFKKFMTWMSHQTVGVDDDGTSLIYDDDLYRYLNKLPIID